MIIDTNTSYAIAAPDGNTIHIPPTYNSDTDVYTGLRQVADISTYFEENGYVVLRNIIPGALCDQARKSFNKEVKPHKGYIYRQASARPEKHVFTTKGYMLNAVMNVQDLPIQTFPHFQDIGVQVLTYESLQQILSILLDQKPILTQSMYFEGNPATWPHQDTHYLDSSEMGKMIGAWIALEDIEPGAGRFYVYPKSHHLSLQNASSHIVLDKKAYQREIIHMLEQNGLKCKAPALKKGDVLLWQSHTIHGSLATLQPQYSRSSFTGHYIPSSTTLLQFQKIHKKMKVKCVNGMYVHFPKDQNKLSNQCIFHLETIFGKPFQFAKKLAIRILTR